MTIYGWDASDFDWGRGPMDLAAARAAGIDWFTHKATEGTTTRHTHYGEALARARAAGVPFLGAYHVVRSGPSIAAQVDYLLAYADVATPWWRTFQGWFWQCDLEKWAYDAVPAQRGVDFCQALAARTGRAVLLYAPRWAYGDSIGGSAPLWASDYVTGGGPYRGLYPGDTSVRWRTYSGRTPVILQYSSTATIGRQPTCDANAFRGDTADFARLIGQTIPGTASAGEDIDMGTASDIIKAWANGNPQAVDGTNVEPVKWQIRNGQWQESVSLQLTSQAAAIAGLGKSLDAALAAIRQLAVATGNDPAPIFAAIKAVGDDAHASSVAVQQQLDAANHKLAMIQAAAEANLSPAERADLLAG